MKINWAFLARNLAAHLAATNDIDAGDRMLGDAEQDATRLAAPADFWSHVAEEYDRQSTRIGSSANESIRTMLRRLVDKPHGPKRSFP